MRFAILSRKKTISFTLVSMLVLALLIISQTASAQVGVDNDGPSFTDIIIKEVDEVIVVDIGVRDLNGWSNIFSINVTVYDDQSRVICQVNFTQYDSLTSDTMLPQYEQIVGSYLDRETSTYTYLEIAPWNPDNTDVPIGLNVIFGFDKFAGDSIRIVCMDKAENPLTCEYSGPFSAEFTPPPSFGDNVAIPISLSTVIAAGGALFLVYRRTKNNQLARAVESNARDK